MGGGPRGDLHTGEAQDRGLRRLEARPGRGPGRMRTPGGTHTQCLGLPAEGSRAPLAGVPRGPLPPLRWGAVPGLVSPRPTALLDPKACSGASSGLTAPAVVTHSAILTGLRDARGLGWWQCPGPLLAPHMNRTAGCGTESNLACWRGGGGTARRPAGRLPAARAMARPALALGTPLGGLERP